MFSLSLGNSSSKILDYTTGSSVLPVNTLMKPIMSVQLIKLFVVLGIALVLGACSALPSDVVGSRSNEAPYPIVLPEEQARIADTLSVWRRLAQSSSIPETAQLKLNPYTATIASLPANTTLFLPKVGEAQTMSEEETRESLRRFIRDWQGLIGADPSQLSLVERTDLPDKTKLAIYAQRPFRYPLRGRYGSLRIGFTEGRRVLEFSSTCIPNADRFQAAIASLSPHLSWEEAGARVLNVQVSFTTGSGQKSTYQLSATNRPQVRELVIFSQDPVATGEPLELRLAWEVAVSNAPFKFVYVDAVKGDIIGTS
jgi:hypothetical protein